MSSDDDTCWKSALFLRFLRTTMRAMIATRATTIIPLETPMMMMFAFLDEPLSSVHSSHSFRIMSQSEYHNLLHANISFVMNQLNGCIHFFNTEAISFFGRIGTAGLSLDFGTISGEEQSFSSDLSAQSATPSHSRAAGRHHSSLEHWNIFGDAGGQFPNWSSLPIYGDKQIKCLTFSTHCCVYSENITWFDESDDCEFDVVISNERNVSEIVEIYFSAFQNMRLFQLSQLT